MYIKGWVAGDFVSLLPGYGSTYYVGDNVQQTLQGSKPYATPQLERSQGGLEVTEVTSHFRMDLVNHLFTQWSADLHEAARNRGGGGGEETKQWLVQGRGGHRAECHPCLPGGS